jgi:hypothetical protein
MEAILETVLARRAEMAFEVVTVGRNREWRVKC